MQYKQTDIYISFKTAFMVNISIHFLFDIVFNYRLFQVIFPCYILRKFQDSDLMLSECR